MRHLPNIARLAKRLRVPALVLASAQDRNDVVKDEFLVSAAPSTSRVLPVSTLSISEVSAVSEKFSWNEFLGLSRGEHFVSVKNPSKFVRFSNLRKSLRCVSIAFGWASLSFGWVCSPALANSDPGRFVMDLSPKGIVFAHHGFANAFPVLTGHALVFTKQVVGASVMQGAAHAARDHLTSSLVWHGNSDNGVKSVETPLYAFERVRAIPSQAAQECVEGVTTRAWSPERTVKPHERATRKGRDSLGYAVTHRSVDKEPCDNSTDEVINISPNSPLSAAQFNPAQYAASVSMSGLEDLQNSGPEQMIDMLEARIKVAWGQLRNRIDYDLYQDGTGNGGKNLTGLAAAVPDTPTTGTYGGISRATWTFWQSGSYSGVTNGGAAVSAANIIQYMTAAGLARVRGTDKTDLWIGDNTYYSYYVNALQAIQRITSDTDATSGFANLMFSGGGMRAKVVLGGGYSGAVSSTQSTSGATSAHMWGLNTNYLYLRPHVRRNFVPIGGERQSVNQDAIVKLIGWAGQLTCSNSFLQTVVIA